MKLQQGKDQKEVQRQVTSKLVNRAIKEGGGHIMDNEENNDAK